MKTASHPATVAYFSMEVGLDASIPTYSGGLGVLAGDTLRAAADLSVPLVAVTLLHRKGYFRQRLDAHGNQTEIPFIWSPEAHLEAMPPRVSVAIEGRDVRVRAWRYVVHGVSGGSIPVYFLDANLEENSRKDQAITDHLYGGDEHYRLCQETVLGLGGVAMLRALGHRRIRTYHMNEGHSSLLTLALLEEQMQGAGESAVAPSDVEAVRSSIVFTTHTPVSAGHDKFRWSLVQRVLGEERASTLEAAGCRHDDSLNMTYLALRFSRYVNGVSMRHGKVSRRMFPDHPISSITNGVHALTWTSEPFRRLYDRLIPDWRRDNAYLRCAMGIPLGDIAQAHAQAKQDLLGVVEGRTGVRLDPGAITIGFARRMTPYKQADLLFSDIDRLRATAQQLGPVQVIYGGKAHPRDHDGKAKIRRVFEAAAQLGDDVRVVYLEEFDLAVARYVYAGVDVWLNNPQKPNEASGTSGMKAAINGVPSLSVLDGWWVEGHVEGVTGWAIGEDDGQDGDPASDAASLYDKLEQAVLPTFYARPSDYAAIMRHAIALNGSFFNSQRMVMQYVENAYASPDIPLANLGYK